MSGGPTYFIRGEPPQSLQLQCVGVGVGRDAIHTLIFEFRDGSQRRACMSGSESLVYSWVDIKLFDYIVQVKGWSVKRGGKYFCQEVKLAMASGQEINFSTSRKRCRKPEMNIDSFSYAVCPPGLVRHVRFSKKGFCMGLDVVLGVSMASLQLRRVIAGVGWAVHGFVLEFMDGSRRGVILSDWERRDLGLSDDSILSGCGDNWVYIDPGDYVVQVMGINNRHHEYLCQSVILVLASGKEINFSPTHDDWQGGQFCFEVPQPGLLRNVFFENGCCQRIDVVRTSAHLPLTREIASHTSSSQQRLIAHVILVGKRIDDRRIEEGGKPLGADIWWDVIEFLRGYDLSPEASPYIICRNRNKPRRSHRLPKSFLWQSKF